MFDDYLLCVYFSRFSINSGYLVSLINCLGMISLSANLLHKGLFSESYKEKEKQKYNLGKQKYVCLDFNILVKPSNLSKLSKKHRHIGLLRDKTSDISTSTCISKCLTSVLLYKYKNNKKTYIIYGHGSHIVPLLRTICTNPFASKL